MKTEYRVVNILKPDFDEIREYCNKHALNMGKWLVLLAKREIEKSKTDSNSAVSNQRK